MQHQPPPYVETCMFNKILGLPYPRYNSNHQNYFTWYTKNQQNNLILIINQTVTLVCTSLLQDYSKVYDREIQGWITACICSIVFYFIFGSLEFQRSWEWNQTTQVTRCSKIIDRQTRAFMYWRKMSTLHKSLLDKINNHSIMDL